MLPLSKSWYDRSSYSWRNKHDTVTQCESHVRDHDLDRSDHHVWRLDAVGNTDPGQRGAYHGCHEIKRDPMGPLARRACTRWRLDHSLCVAAGSAGLDSALDRFNLASSHLCANLGSSVFGSTLWPRVLRLIQYAAVPRCRIDADCSVDDRSGAIARRRR